MSGIDNCIEKLLNCGGGDLWDDGFTPKGAQVPHWGVEDGAGAAGADRIAYSRHVTGPCC